MCYISCYNINWMPTKLCAFCIEEIHLLKLTMQIRITNLRHLDGMVLHIIKDVPKMFKSCDTKCE